MKRKRNKFPKDEYPNYGMRGKIAWNKDKKCPQLSGKNNGMYGKTKSKKTKNKLSKSLKEGYRTGRIINGMKGKSRPNVSKRMKENNPMKKSKQKKRMRKNNPMHNLEIAKRSGLSRKGIKRSEESKKKQSIAIMGKNHYNWQGGISFEPYGIEFNNALKLIIRTRDDFTCQECGYTEEQLGYTLGIHHIDYNKKNNIPKNLISLCKSCHIQTNFKRNDWTNYFQNKIVGEYND